MKLTDILKGKLNDAEIALVTRSYDVVGDIAILEIPDELTKKEKIIAEAIMELNKNVKVVAKKVGPTSGEERIRPIKVILGENRTETSHMENGIKYKLDINKTYFSPRLGSEHLRVVNQIKSTEIVYDLFAGVGPFAIPAAKKAKHVFAVDINKASMDYLKENAFLNKVVNKIDIFVGDARKVAEEQKWVNVADRIIMNLPMHAGDFLDIAVKIAKKGAIVHFYFFLPEEELFDGAIKLIEAAAEKAKRKVKVLVKRKCGQLAPWIWRIVIDFKID